jgi:hypothetical protein
VRPEAAAGVDAVDGGDHGFGRANGAADELVAVRGEPAEPGFVRAVPARFVSPATAPVCGPVMVS